MSQTNLISIRIDPTRKEDTERLSQSDLISVSRILSVLFLVWGLLRFSGHLDFANFETLFVTGGVLLVAYWVGCFATRHSLRFASTAIVKYFKNPAVDELNASTEYWSISEKAIRRHHTNHEQVFSLNSVVIVDQKQPEQVDVTFCNGGSVSFTQANCESERGWYEAVEILKGAPGANRNIRADIDPVVEAAEVESCYNKEEVRLLHQKDGSREHQRKYLLLQGSLFLLLMCCLVVNEWFSDDFSPFKAIAVGCGMSVGSFFNVFSFWGVGKMELHQTHFWRVSRQDFRFGTRHQNAYEESIRNWDDLVEAEETERGFVVSFHSPRQVTLIPKDSAPLRQWEQVASKLRKFAGNKMRHKL